MIRLADLLAGGLIAAGPGYMPERASSVAEGVDQVFGFLFWLSAFFLAVRLTSRDLTNRVVWT